MTLRRRPMLHRWLHLWVVLAVVLAPALGRMHQVLHGSGHAPGVPHVLQLAQAGHDAHDHGQLGDLFAEHAAGDCLLLDQLTLGGALHHAPPTLPGAAPADVPAAACLPAPVARAVLAFDARAPPAGLQA